MPDRANVTKIGNKFRVTGADGRPLQTKDSQAVDGGGYPTEGLAKFRASEINTYYEKRAEAWSSVETDGTQES